VLQDNPRNYTYRQGINIGHPDTYVMTVQGLDGDTVNLPVEYAGESVRADLIPIGDPVVMHQLYPQKWIVIGREGADVSVLIYMSGIFDYPIDPCGSYWMRAYKPSEGIESQWTCDSCVEVSPGMFTCESGHFWPPIISPWEDDFVTYSYITAAAGIEANLTLGDTLEFSWPYGSFDGSDVVQCFIRRITGPTDAEYQLSYTLTYIEDSIEKTLTGTWSLIARTTDQIFTGITADSTTISSVTLRVTLEAA